MSARVATVFWPLRRQSALLLTALVMARLGTLRRQGRLGRGFGGGVWRGDCGVWSFDCVLVFVADAGDHRCS